MNAHCTLLTIIYIEVSFRESFYCTLGSSIRLAYLEFNTEIRIQISLKTNNFNENVRSSISCPCSTAASLSSMLGSISPGATEDMLLESGHSPDTPVPARASDDGSDSEYDSDYNAEDNTFVIGSDIDEMVTAYENLMTLTNPLQDRVHSSESTTQPQVGSVLQMVRAAITPIEPSREIDSAESSDLAFRRRDDSPLDLTDLLETPPGQVTTQNEERLSCTFQDPQALTATDIEHMDEETREWLVSFVEITEDLNRRGNPIPESLSGELPLRELYVDVGDHHPERTSALLRRRIVRRNRQLGFGNELVPALGHEQSNGNNEEFTSKEELTVLRRYYC